jgi:hypothetical protein
MYGGEGRCVVGKREEKRPLGRHRLRWSYNFKMDLQEMRREDLNWIDLAEVNDKW